MPITSARLAPYRRRVFVETGAYAGDGIYAALGAGFEEIWSIEIVPECAENCRKRFAGDPRVNIILGASEEKFPEVLRKINEPATFWLDAHGFPNFNMPLVDELDAIRASGNKDHILLLDDMWESDKQAQRDYRLHERLLAINPDYKIYWIDGQQEGCLPAPKTIMVGDPRKVI